jgi:hypothetical protein
VSESKSARSILSSRAIVDVILEETLAAIVLEGEISIELEAGLITTYGEPFAEFYSRYKIGRGRKAVANPAQRLLLMLGGLLFVGRGQVMGLGLGQFFMLRLLQFGARHVDRGSFPNGARALFELSVESHCRVFVILRHERWKQRGEGRGGEEKRRECV